MAEQEIKFAGQKALLKALGLPDDLVDDFFDPESRFSDERARKHFADYYREALADDQELGSKIWNQKKYQKDEEFMRLLKQRWPITDEKMKEKANKGIKEYLDVIQEMQKTGDKTIDELTAKNTELEGVIQEFQEEIIPQIEQAGLDAVNELNVRYAFRERLKAYNVSEERGKRIMNNMIRDLKELKVKMVPDDSEPHGIQLVGEDGKAYRPSTEAKPWQFTDKLTEELQFMGILNSDGELLSGSRTPPNEPANAAPPKGGSSNRDVAVNHGANSGNRRTPEHDGGLSDSRQRIAELENKAKAKREKNPMG
jgi:hypothetical protein